jgi:prephenate dehydratase
MIVSSSGYASMPLAIAHLGPAGTNAETAAQAFSGWLQQHSNQDFSLYPYASIAQTLQGVAKGRVDLAVVPVENSIEGGVAITLDTLWQLDILKIQQALVLPITHALLSYARELPSIQTVYSHPQALGQCQKWLEQHLPQAQQIPMNSTTEALGGLAQDSSLAAIAAPKAADLYNLPTLVCPINDHPDNCTRFWVIGLENALAHLDSLNSNLERTQTSLAFSLPMNAPGALVQALLIFADRGINLSRIESRPSKRSLGDYLFFIDLEGNAADPSVQTALQQLAGCTETLKIFGSYAVLSI